MQQIGHRDSIYERPNQKWVCGWAAEGRPCRFGPDGKGRCTAAAQSECKPGKKGDRWYCTRPELFGGACALGPLPDGSCCRPDAAQPICQPRLTLRAKRGRLAVACTCLCVGALLVLIAGPWGMNFLSPGPLTSAHAVMEGPTGAASNCANCHQPHDATSGFLQPVTAQRCLKCHVAEAHHPTRSVEAGLPMQVADRLGTFHMAVACTRCHQEHRGREHSLVRVADHVCTQCHDQVSHWRKTEISTVGTLTTLPIKPPVEEGVADSITNFAKNHPEFDVLTNGRIDSTPIRFEHHKHLDPDSSLIKRNIEAWIKSVKEDNGSETGEIPVRRLEDDTYALACTACHQTDAGGRYMQPIRFEHHCAHCHNLGKEKRSGEKVPHGSQINDFIWRAAARVVAQSPKQKAGKGGGPKPKAKPGPRRGPRPKPKTESKAEADTESKVASKKIKPQIKPEPEITPFRLIEKDVGRLAGNLAKKCTDCHGPVEDVRKIVEPKIPRRWLLRARFDHEMHRMMTCVECHAQADPEFDPPPTADSGGPDQTLEWTGHTKQVMLPSIQLCYRCHSPKAVASSPSRDQSAPHRCVTCHSYHEPSLSPNEGGALPVAANHVIPNTRPSRHP